MILPEDFSAVLKAPVFIISRDQERYNICRNRVRRAGFTGHILQAPGVDRENQDEIDREWARHPFLPNHKPFGQHPAAVMLAHLNLWKHITELNILYVTIFEDDMLFHTEWETLAPQYYQHTPKNTDMIFMGHHCGNVHPEAHIIETPVYCLNAYIITCDGVRKLYEMITKYPYEDFGVIDMMLVRLQHDILINRRNPYKYHWYVWNSQMYPDNISEKYKNRDALTKDMGLVFQQYPFFALEQDNQ